MSSKDFMALVARMRRTQRDYQRSKDYVMLKEAQRLEVEVDLEISKNAAAPQGNG